MLFVLRIWWYIDCSWWVLKMIWCVLVVVWCSDLVCCVLDMKFLFVFVNLKIVGWLFILLLVLRLMFCFECLCSDFWVCCLAWRILFVYFVCFAVCRFGCDIYCLWFWWCYFFGDLWFGDLWWVVLFDCNCFSLYWLGWICVLNIVFWLVVGLSFLFCLFNAWLRSLLGLVAVYNYCCVFDFTCCFRFWIWFCLLLNLWFACWFVGCLVVYVGCYCLRVLCFG